MKEKRERRMRNQIATFIPEIILFILGLAMIALLAYNFIFARGYLVGEPTTGKWVGKLINFVLFVVSCSVSAAAGIAMLVISIVGRYKDRIMWPHHISFITSFVFMVVGVTFLCLCLLVDVPFKL